MYFSQELQFNCSLEHRRWASYFSFTSKPFITCSVLSFPHFIQQPPKFIFITVVSAKIKKNAKIVHTVFFSPQFRKILHLPKRGTTIVFWHCFSSSFNVSLFAFPFCLHFFLFVYKCIYKFYIWKTKEIAVTYSAWKNTYVNIYIFYLLLTKQWKFCLELKIKRNNDFQGTILTFKNYSLKAGIKAGRYPLLKSNS